MHQYCIILILSASLYRKRGVSILLSPCNNSFVIYFIIFQRKVKANAVIEQAHVKQDTEERDFFSLFYYDGYSVTKDNQEIHLQQKVLINLQNKLIALTYCTYDMYISSIKVRGEIYEENRMIRYCMQMK